MNWCWIFGNGPSLNETDLDLFTDEVCFGCNYIYKLFDKTRWRPRYWVASDAKDDGISWTFMLKNMLSHYQEFDRIFLRDYGVRFMTDPRIWDSKITYLHFKECGHRESTPPEHSPTEWHLPQVCLWPSTVHVAIQIAVKKPFDEIYLVGCDLGNEHFHPHYPTPVPDAGRLIAGHEIAYQECRSRDIGIYNATVGGELDVYPRIDYREVLHG